jgi:hypothetical protein
MTKPLHTSDRRKFDHIWTEMGGRIVHIHQTGELRYLHSSFAAGIRTNGRRKDVPAKLLTQINKLLRQDAANERW